LLSVAVTFVSCGATNHYDTEVTVCLNHRLS